MSMSETAEKAGVVNVPVKSGVAAYLTVGGATKASDLYVKAFGAQEKARMPVDEQGRTMHIHLYINNASVMLMDPMPEYGVPLQAPQAFLLHLQVDDVDQWWNRAVAAGLEITTPLQLMFWGDRYGQLKDAFGVSWSIGGK